jgi:hypothetical protein
LAHEDCHRIHSRARHTPYAQPLIIGSFSPRSRAHSIAMS